MRAVVDANVWIAAFDPAEPHYADSIAFLNEAAAQNAGLFGPSLILPEVAATCARVARDVRKGEEAIARLQQIPGMQFAHLTAERAAEAGKMASRLFLKGADSFYAALAAELGAELVTLDRELRERTIGELTSLSPVEWLARHVPKSP